MKRFLKLDLVVVSATLAVAIVSTVSSKTIALNQNRGISDCSVGQDATLAASVQTISIESRIGVIDRIKKVTAGSALSVIAPIGSIIQHIDRTESWRASINLIDTVGIRTDRLDDQMRAISTHSIS